MQDNVSDPLQIPQHCYLWRPWLRAVCQHKLGARTARTGWTLCGQREEAVIREESPGWLSPGRYIQCLRINEDLVATDKRGQPWDGVPVPHAWDREVSLFLTPSASVRATTFNHPVACIPLPVWPSCAIVFFCLFKKLFCTAPSIPSSFIQNTSVFLS